MKRWILYTLTFLGIGAVLAAIAVPGMVMS
jgi:hypothetical protein